MTDKPIFAASTEAVLKRISKILSKHQQFITLSFSTT